MAFGCGVKSLVCLSAFAMLCHADSPTKPYKAIFHLENLESGKSGEVIVDVHPEWAPLAAQRFEELVEQQFFDNNRFFRVVTGFVAQFGISGNPKVQSEWERKSFPDDAPHDHVHNSRGMLSFYTDGKDDRNTQIVFNIKDNDFLDEKGYVPFAEVADGIFLVDRIFNKYGGASKAPDTKRLATEGNAYVDKEFPELTYIKSVEIVKAPPATLTTSSTSVLSMALGVCIITGILGGGWLFNSGKVAPQTF